VLATYGRRLLAEFTGTGLLVAIVVGSGIAATNLTSDGGLRLLINSLVTAMGLAVLILIFMPAGVAQFNPVVTGVDWLLSRRTDHRYGLGQALVVIGCQIAGAIAGAALADAMFRQSTSFANPAVTIGRSLTNTYAGIAPSSVAPFIAAQIIGGGIGTLLGMALHPLPRGRASSDDRAQLTG
jgi:glycerol uptake facilitator-like aquaporin